jgi:hypothetical protein
MPVTDMSRFMPEHCLDLFVIRGLRQRRLRITMPV